MLSNPSALAPRSVKFPVEPNNQKPPSLNPKPASIEKYEMYTLPVPSKSVKKGWATPQPSVNEKDRILKKLEMATLDLRAIPRTSVMTKDGKRRKLPQMIQN